MNSLYTKTEQRTENNISLIFHTDTRLPPAQQKLLYLELLVGEENVGVLAYHPPTAGHHLQPQHPREPPRAVRRHRDLYCAEFEHLNICDLHLHLWI